MTAAIARAALPVLAAGALFAAATGFLVVGLSKIESMIENAAETAKVERDAYWTAQIEKSSAIANRQIADQAKAALVIEANATTRVREAELQLFELEKKNAALPNGDACGLSRDRVRLLPN